MTLVDENGKAMKIVNDYACKSLVSYIQELEENDYKIFENVKHTLDSNFEKMKKFIELLP